MKRRSRLDPTRYITDESQVPAGWPTLASVADTPSERRALSKAHREGQIKAVKLVRSEAESRTGRVWLEPTEAAVWLGEYRGILKREPLVRTPQIDDLVSSLSRDIAALNDSINELRAAVELGLDHASKHLAVLVEQGQ